MVCVIHMLSGKILWINLHLCELFCFISNDEIDMIFVLCLRNSEYITVYVLYTLQHVFVSTHCHCWEGTQSK
jgi:hypothetical protein